MSSIMSKLENQTLLGQLYKPSWKWLGIIPIQIGIGLLCIFLPWYHIVALSIIIALTIFLHVKLRLWAYILIFLTPTFGVKLPGIYTNEEGLGKVDSVPLLLVLSLIPSLSHILNTSAKFGKDTKKNPLFVPILLLVCYSILTLFWSPANISFNINYFFYLIANISLFYFLFHIIDNEDFHRRLMWCLVFSGIILSVQTLVTWFSVISDNPIIIKGITTVKILDWLNLETISRTSEKEQPVHGFFFGPQETAIMLNIVIFIALGLLLTEKEKVKRYFLLGTILILIWAVFSTGTKSGTWSLFIMVYFFLLISIKFRKKFFRNAFTFFLVILFVFMSSSITGRSKTKDPRLVSVSTEEESSLGKRIGYWKTGLKELDKRSLNFFGLGIGGFKYSTKSKFISHAHNVYLSLFFDFGFMGIIIICLVILILSKIFLKIANHQRTYLQNMSLAFGVNLILIGIVGLVYIPYYMSVLWFLLALASATFHLAQNELSASERIDDTTIG